MPNYCTPEQVAAGLGIDDELDAPLLALSASAASRMIEAETGWRFWKDTTVTVRTYFPCYSGELDIIEDEYPGCGIADTTGLLVKVDTDDNGTFDATLTLSTDFILSPTNAGGASRPWTEIFLTNPSVWFRQSAYRRPTVQVTALFGWPEIPGEVEEAAVLLASSIYKSKDTVGGTLGSPGGSALHISDFNPVAAALLVGVSRPRVG